MIITIWLANCWFSSFFRRQSASSSNDVIREGKYNISRLLFFITVSKRKADKSKILLFFLLIFHLRVLVILVSPSGKFVMAGHLQLLLLPDGQPFSWAVKKNRHKHDLSRYAIPHSLNKTDRQTRAESLKDFCLFSPPVLCPYRTGRDGACVSLYKMFPTLFLPSFSFSIGKEKMKRCPILIVHIFRMTCFILAF